MLRKNDDLILKANRKIREKIFHDEVFETKARRKLSVFYSIVESVRKEFAESLLEYTSKRILEIGCELGVYAISVALKGAKVSAIDISEYAIKEVKKRCNNKNLKIDFKIMDAENLKFKENEFDLVYGLAILHHLNLKAVIPEIHRVLRKGGKAIFIEPMAHNPFINVFRFLTPKLRSKDEHPLRMQDLRLLSKDFSGFKFEFYYFLSLFAVPFCKLPFFNRIKYSLEKLDKKLFTVIPSLKRFAWQVLLILEK